MTGGPTATRLAADLPPHPVAANDTRAPFGLTMPQLAILFDQAMHTGKPIYNTGQTLVIRAPLDVARFSAAVDQAVAEIDALRLRLTQRGGQVHQEFAEDVRADLEIVDCSSDESPAQAAKAWMDENFWQALSPMGFPLFRYALIKLAADHFIWFQKYHHLIIDATGRQLVAARVADIYNARSDGQAPVWHGGSFRMAKTAEAEYLASQAFVEDESYWRARLANPVASLFTADPRLSERSRSGRPVRYVCELPPAISEGLRATARQYRSSPFKILTVLTWSCLNRLYGHSDITFGVATAGRATSESKRVVGLFSKVMPFRVSLAVDMRFGEALEAIDRTLAADLTHQRFPISQLNREPRAARLGAYDVAINYVRNDFDFEIGGVSVECGNLSSGFVEPLRIMALEFSARAPISFVIDYDAGRIAPEEFARFVNCFQASLALAPPDLEMTVGTLSVSPTSMAIA